MLNNILGWYSLILMSIALLYVLIDNSESVGIRLLSLVLFSPVIVYICRKLFCQ